MHPRLISPPYIKEWLSIKIFNRKMDFWFFIELINNFKKDSKAIL